ncbi:WXG100 family type VII secretion target [Nocardia stercoris]|uniref:ESAT-6-like protein n=1 Tax=Nocardia stercoris TaxID=2483361 RepID=A0A3M2L1P9_9NOCA|nr:WXG100 family type VII secretion target [Nocardia stercoris]RMI28468.1 hypothetical protein EBN03_30055 [Nocardia stercoris]
MGNYRADLTGISTLIDDTHALEKALEDAISELDTQIESLHVSWTGDAADSHREAHTDRVSAVGDMQDALKVLRDKLTKAHTSYTEGAEAAHERWP